MLAGHEVVVTVQVFVPEGRETIRVRHLQPAVAYDHLRPCVSVVSATAELLESILARFRIEGPRMPSQGRPMTNSDLVFVIRQRFCNRCDFIVLGKTS